MMITIYQFFYKIHSFYAIVEVKKYYMGKFETPIYEYELVVKDKRIEKYKIRTTENYKIGSVVRIDVNALKYVVHWDVN